MSQEEHTNIEYELEKDGFRRGRGEGVVERRDSREGETERVRGCQGEKGWEEGVERGVIVILDL